MSTEEKPTKQSAAIQARNAAMSELIEKYNEEYTTLLNQKRRDRGLDPISSAMSRKRDRAMAQIKKLREQGFDVRSLEDQLNSSNW